VLPAQVRESSYKLFEICSAVEAAVGPFDGARRTNLLKAKAILRYDNKQIVDFVLPFHSSVVISVCPYGQHGQKCEDALDRNHEPLAIVEENICPLSVEVRISSDL